MSVPIDAGRGTGDRDSTFLLQFHVVHGCSITATTDLLHLMNATSEIQNPLAQRRFARVNMCGNTNVTNLAEIHRNYYQNNTLRVEATKP